MLEPRGTGIVLWSLRYGDEVRDEETYLEGIGDERADSDMNAADSATDQKEDSIGTRRWATTRFRTSRSQCIEKVVRDGNAD